MYWGEVRERNGAREMALQVRTLSAIAKDLSFVPSTHEEGSVIAERAQNCSFSSQHQPQGI